MFSRLTKYNPLFISLFAVILVTAGTVNVIVTKKKEASQNATLAEIVEAINDNVYLPPETPFFPEKTLDYFEEVLQFTQSWSLHTNYLHRLTEGGRYEEAIQLAETIAQTATEEEVKKYIHPLLIANYVKLGLQENCACTPCIAPLRNYHFSELEHFEKAYELLKVTKSFRKPLISGYLLYPTSRLFTWRRGPLLNFLEKVLKIENGNKLPKPKKAGKKKKLAISPFQNITVKAGLEKFTEAGSAVMEDFNKDGYLDLVVINMGMNSPLRYYENDKAGGFIEKTDRAGLNGLVGGTHIVQTDYNNDGWLDIFITRGGLYGKYGLIPNSLLKNNGDGTFTDVTREAGLFTKYPSLTAVWADFNNDGWLDLFVGNDDILDLRIYSEFYLNNGDGTFRDVTMEVGLNFRNQVRSALPMDYDKDGDKDLFVFSFDQPIEIYINNYQPQDKKIHFTKAKQNLLPEQIKVHQNYFSTFFDYNNDGDTDIFYSRYMRQFNQNSEDYFTLLDNQGNDRLVYKNNGINFQADVIGLAHGDFNNDGFIDLFKTSESLQPNRMLLNNQGKGFHDVTINAGIGNYIQGNGVSLGDIDNDGDQDLYIVNGGYVFTDKACDALLENTLESSNWISLKLEGVKANRAAIGTTVEVTIIKAVETSKLYRTINVGNSLGSSSLRLNIGLGTAEKIKTIKVNWFGSDTVQIFENVGINQHYQLTEGKALVRREALD